MSSIAKRLGRVVPLPNIKLRLNPPVFKSAADAERGVDEVVFVTTPDVTKIEVKRFLERAYGIAIADVRTSNLDGKKKRDRGGFHQRADVKKVYVTLKERWYPPTAFAAAAASARASTESGEFREMKGTRDEQTSV